MGRPVRSFVLAIVSLILCPVLIFVEVVAFMIAAMVTYEPANSLPVKIGSVVVVILLGVIALTLPSVSIVWANRARMVTTTEGAERSGLAIASLVIGGVVLAGVVIAQIYLILWLGGVCSLEGC